VVLGEQHNGVVLDERFQILQRKVAPSSQGLQQSKNDLDYLTFENESDKSFNLEPLTQQQNVTSEKNGIFHT
jgi:hypothetical protein